MLYTFRYISIEISFYSGTDTQYLPPDALGTMKYIGSLLNANKSSKTYFIIPDITNLNSHRTSLNMQDQNISALGSTHFRD